MHALSEFVNMKKISHLYVIQYFYSKVLYWENSFFESKKVLLIQKNVLWSKEIDLFTLKKIFLNQQNFLQFKEILCLTVYQRNISLIQRNCFLGVCTLLTAFGWWNQEKTAAFSAKESVVSSRQYNVRIASSCTLFARFSPLGLFSLSKLEKMARWYKICEQWRGGVCG